MPNAQRVSVIIVSFNTVECLRRCLATLERHHEVIVVDNGSGDGSAEMVRGEFPGVTLVENMDNRGFGAANNQALAIMKARYALLLNSDAIPEPGSIDRLADFLETNQRVIAVGGGLKFPDGRWQNSGARALTLTAVFGEQTFLEKLGLPRYWEKPGPPDRRVNQVMGACLMFRPVERFDERFFLYCEDTELCRRLSSHGEIWYLPSATFSHELGASSTKDRWLSVARYNRGKELYFEIHHGKLAAYLCFLTNRFGALLRLTAWLSKSTLSPRGRGSDEVRGEGESPRAKVRLFWRVLTAPRLGPQTPPRSPAEPHPESPRE